MQDYWCEKEVKNERSFRSQSAVKPLYGESVERKRSLEREEGQKGAQVKAGLLGRHEGRQERVHRLHERRREAVAEPHRQQIGRVL